MAAPLACTWSGVFPAATTQFDPALNVDLSATQAVQAALVRDRDAEHIGLDGLMVLPAMVYVPTPAELEHHFRTVAQASGLPVMLYNNPHGSGLRAYTPSAFAPCRGTP